MKLRNLFNILLEGKQNERIKHIDTDDVLLVEPLSHDASCRYGRNALWCTSMRGLDHHYVTKTAGGQRLVYLILDPMFEGARFAIHWDGVQALIYNDKNQVVPSKEVYHTAQNMGIELQGIHNSIRDMDLAFIIRKILK